MKTPSLLLDASVFFLGAALEAMAVHWMVPHVVASGVPSLAAWMLVAVPVVFIPLLGVAFALLRNEHTAEPWRARLRLRRPTRADGRWIVGGVLAIAAGGGAMFALCNALGLDPYPPFSRGLPPIDRSTAWIVGVWLVYWPVNILGEELVWRGVLLPRMEARLGTHAWLANAALWTFFHLGFGIGNLLVILPTMFTVPFIAQRTRSTWVGVLLHASLSLPGFIHLAISGTPG